MTPPGALEVPGAVNLRDVGGLPAGGAVTRHGVLFRSGNLAQLDARGTAALGGLGLRRIIDLRADDVFSGIRFGDGAEAVTLRHLLTMTSGIDFRWFGHEPVMWPDLAGEMLSRPSAGRRFQYSDVSTYVAMRMLATVVGDVRDWLLPRLFQPLEIDNPQWHRCPLGFIIGGTGLELRTEELARIGRVLLDRGRWNDRALVSPGWVDSMHESWVYTGNPPPMDRYGIATWAGPGGAWRLEGRYGQFVLINGDAVVTITAHEESLEDRLSELAAELTT